MSAQYHRLILALKMDTLLCACKWIQHFTIQSAGIDFHLDQSFLLHLFVIASKLVYGTFLVSHGQISPCYHRRHIGQPLSVIHTYSTSHCCYSSRQLLLLPLRTHADQAINANHVAPLLRVHCHSSSYCCSNGHCCYCCSRPLLHTFAAAHMLTDARVFTCCSSLCCCSHLCYWSRLCYCSHLCYCSRL